MNWVCFKTFIQIALILLDVGLFFKAGVGYFFFSSLHHFSMTNIAKDSINLFKTTSLSFNKQEPDWIGYKYTCQSSSSRKDHIPMPKATTLNAI